MLRVIVTFWPSTTKVFFCRFGLKTRLVRRKEKLTLLPNCLPLPVSSHRAAMVVVPLIFYNLDQYSVFRGNRQEGLHEPVGEVGFTSMGVGPLGMLSCSKVIQGVYMSYESDIHAIQLLVLRKLLFATSAGFADLQRESGVTSDHFTFHLKKLVGEGFVEKNGDAYSLTRRGKEFANRLDTDENTIEKQPKISIAITLERRGRDGEREFLFQQRKKNPYFDFWGRVGGKMRWGETVIEAAKRELLEETGLVAELEYRLLYHKRDYDKASSELLEDKIFLCVYANAYKGELIEEFEGGVNRWMTHEEFQSQPKRFKSVDEFKSLMDAGEVFAEKSFYYDKSEY